MKVILEPHLAGASGDMLLAALLAVGADAGILARWPAVPEMGVRSVSAAPAEVSSGGIKALHLDVHIEEEPLARDLGQMKSLLEKTGERLGASPAALEKAASAIDLVFRAEAAVHGGTPQTVHLHEVGAYDTILDTLGYFCLLESLGNPEVLSSIPAAGGGTVMTAHGLLPVPVPAVVAIAAETGLPLKMGPVGEEILTPTGAALLAVSASFEAWPSCIRVLRVGYGAGTKKLAIPNVLRALLAETAASGHPHDGGTAGHRHPHPHGHSSCHGHSHGESPGKE